MYTYSKADKAFIKHIVYNKEINSFFKINSVFKDFKYKDYIRVITSNLREVLNQHKHAK